MTPNRTFLNLLITKKLTKKDFGEIKDGLVINETFLEEFLKIEPRKTVDKSILSSVSSLIVEFVEQEQSRIKILLNLLKDQFELSPFCEQLLRKLKKTNPCKELDFIMDNYAI